MSERDPAREGVSAYQRWEMASFDPVPPPEPVDEHDFEAELQLLRDAAHAEGVATGHVAGQALGYQAGYEQGHAKGLEQGRAEAHKEAARVTAIADTFTGALGAAQNEVSEALVALALDIAQQVVRQHV